MKQAEVVQPKAREWIPLLDAIRGLAVIGVVMTHAYHASRISNIYDKSGLLHLGSILGAGSSVRVPLLFWLSGFLMSLVSLTYIGKSTTFDLFIRRRLIRILPTWWTALGLVYASSIMTSIMNNQPLPAWSIAKLLTNLTITSFLFNEVAEIGVAWTLGIEIQLYFVFSVLLATANSIKLKLKIDVFDVVSVALIPVFMLIPDHPNGNVYFHRIWPWFVLGALTHRSVFLGQNRLFGIVTLAFITGSLLPFRENLTLPYIVRATTVVCLSLLLFNTSNSKVWIFGKGLSGLANISFPLFLVHMTIVRHSHFVLQFTNRFNVLPIFTYIMIVGMSLLLAIAITPLMNRIDKFLMAKLFVRPAQKV